MTTKKKAFIIIGIMIFSVLITSIGLPLRYNSIYAKIDIKFNNAKIIKTEIPFLHLTELDGLTKKYGFEYSIIPNYEKLSYLQKKGIRTYNAVIEKHIDSINGENWKIKMESKIDSIEKTKIPAIY